MRRSLRWRSRPRSSRPMVAHCRRESPLECCGILGGDRHAGLVVPPAAEHRRQRDPLRRRSPGPDQGVRLAPRERPRDRWRSTTRTRAGRPSPARPTWRRTTTAPCPGSSSRCSPIRRTCGSGGSSRIRYAGAPLDPGRNRSARLPRRCNHRADRTRLVSRIVSRDRDFRKRGQRSRDVRAGCPPRRDMGSFACNVL